MLIQSLAISNAQRVTAVHRQFAEKSGSDVTEVIYYLALGVLAVLCILVAVNRIQQRLEARKNAEHRAQLRDQVRKTHQLRAR
jgi:hypothetical protein